MKNKKSPAEKKQQTVNGDKGLAKDKKPDHVNTAEEALQESVQESAFKAELLQKAPVIAAFHDKDQNIVWANQAYEEATGALLRNVAGKKCYSVWNLPGPCQGCPVLTAIATGENSEAELTPQNQKTGLRRKAVGYQRLRPFATRKETSSEL